MRENESVWSIGGMMLKGQKLKYCEIKLSHCHCVHKKSHMDWLGIKPRPLQ